MCFLHLPRAPLLPDSRRVVSCYLIERWEELEEELELEPGLGLKGLLSPRSPVAGSAFAAAAAE